MATYTVTVRREIVRKIVVNVKADSQAEAEMKALRKAKRGMEKIRDWVEYEAVEDTDDLVMGR